MLHNLRPPLLSLSLSKALPHVPSFNIYYAPSSSQPAPVWPSTHRFCTTSTPTQGNTVNTSTKANRPSDATASHPQQKVVLPRTNPASSSPASPSSSQHTPKVPNGGAQGSPKPSSQSNTHQQGTAQPNQTQSKLTARTHQQVHIPVMLNEVVRALNVKPGGIYVDATFGAGGHTKAILDSCQCKVYAIDRDKNAFAHAPKSLEQYKGRLIPVHGNFGSMVSLLKAEGVTKVDGILFDLGMSALQLDTPERGFAFRKAYNGPLDMRMDAPVKGQGGSEITAEDVVNNLDVDELTHIIATYGEDHASRIIAKAIVEHREKQRITTTKQLANLVRSVMPRPESMKIDPATRTFQAIRIYVNNEFEEIDSAMVNAEHLLNPSGRLAVDAVISFHSLEDKRVVNYLKISCGMRPPANKTDLLPPTFRLLSRKAIFASEEEVKENPRARSAVLRVAERNANPPNNELPS